MPDFWSNLFQPDELTESVTELKDDFLRLLLDSMAEALYVIDRQGRCIACNDRCVSLLGYSAKGDLLGRNMHELIHHSHADGSPYDENECHIYRAFRRGEKVHVDDEVFWRKDGSRFDAEYASYPLKQGGVVTGAVVTFFDITKRRETELDLRLRTAAIDQAINGVLITDPRRPDNPIVYANSTFNRMTGYTQENCIGNNCRFLQGPDTDREAVDRIRTAIEEERESLEVLLNYRKDGSTFWNELRVSPVRNESGELTAFIGIQSDVTEREENRIALERERQRAEAASQAKSEFLAHVSHELRSPMTAILGYADLIQEAGLDETNSEYLRTIRRNGDYLLRLINDILDLSKIEAGRLTLEEEDTDLGQLVEEVRSLMAVKAREKKIEFSASCKTPVPARIRTDPVRLRQMLVNLISNAIKFTDDGRVDLLLRLDGDAGMLSFAVQDTGIGISPDGMNDLFQPFTQIADQSGSTRQGTGLGLSISRRLAQAMGGDLTAESQLGEGSTFTVKLPVTCDANTEMVDSLSAVKRPSADDDDREITLTGHYLVTDDRRDIRHLLRHFLKKAGATVEFAEHGAAAVKRLTEDAEGQPDIDALLLDMQMPTMTGYEAAAKLRKSGFTKPIIALTANAMKGEREKCLEAGCDDFLTKPIDARMFLKTVAKWQADVVGDDD